MTTLEFTFWPILLAAAVKSAAWLFLACAFACGLIKTSAAVRHTHWLLALAGLLLIPLFSITLPQWKILPAPPPASEFTAFTTNDINIPPSQPQVSPPEISPVQPPPPEIAPINWPALAVIAWAIGATFFLSPTLIGLFVLLRLGSRSSPIHSDEWTKLLHELSEKLHLTRPVRLLQSRQHSMPMIWGVRRATLLLPAESDHWSPQRKRLVLLHELAHVQRRDSLSLLIAQFARAMYWFNPLAWFAFRRLAIEREHACDDIVLTAGHKPSDYAQELLTVATGYRPATLAGLNAVAIARASTLEKRLRAILDSTRKRNLSTRRAIAISVMTLFSLLIPLAALHQSVAAPGDAPSSADSWTTTLPSGIQVQLIGGASSPSPNQPWWKPDGSPLAAAPYHDPLNAKVFPQPNQIAREFALRLTNLPPDYVDAVWRFDPDGSSAGGGPVTQDGKTLDDLRAVCVSLPAGNPTVNIRVGIASGPWQTENTDTDLSSSSSYGDIDASVAFAPLAQKDSDLTATVTHDLTDKQTRVVAITTNGALHNGSTTQTAGGNHFQQMTVTFSNLGIKDIKSIELQSRPYQWADFKNVAAGPISTAPPLAPRASAPLHGRVLTADGAPVRGATVFLALPGNNGIRIRNGIADELGRSPHTLTNNDGQFNLPPQTGDYIVGALANEGYGQASRFELNFNPNIYIAGWGKIAGRVMIGTSPGVGLQLQAYRDDRSIFQSPITISMINRAQTGSDGTFTMNRVLPGQIDIDENVDQQSGANTMTFSEFTTITHVAAGQTSTVNIGGVGRPVVGKIVFPPEMNPDDYFLNARAFTQFPSFLARLAHPTALHMYFLHVDADRNFRMNNVVPGNYRISFILETTHNVRALRSSDVNFTMPDIPGGVSDDPLVLPDIHLK